MSPIKLASAAMDPGLAQTVASVSGVAAVVTVLQDAALLVLGVPLGVPLAGFAGACYGASFREPRTPSAFWRSVLVTTVFASIVAPLAAKVIGVPDLRYFAGVAAVLAWALEWGAPWLKRNGSRLMDDLWARTVGRAVPKPRDPPAAPEPKKRGAPGDET